MIAPCDQGGGGAIDFATGLQEVRRLSQECQTLSRMLGEVRARLTALAKALSIPSGTAGAEIAVIVRLVCADYGITPDALHGRGRSEVLVEPRHLAISISYDLLPLSTAAIAKAFDRDHGMVLYIRRRVADACSINPSFRQRRERLLALARSAIKPAPQPPTVTP